MSLRQCLFTAGLVAGLSSVGAAQAADGASQEDQAQAGIAVLSGTEGNADVHATIRFMPTDDGLAYTTVAHGLKPGKHGYHIHIYGDCSGADGKSAGTHYNLQGSSLNPPKDIDRITGDLGNLVADANGDAHDTGVLENGALTGPKSIIGRAVIIHAKANDPSQPPIGAAGARQACGVIGIADPAKADQDTAKDDT
ncbi:superoxide dismutase family protein [Salinisphaera sp. Q1T1-3]|uniref:superoxide dismutase family protein n=1 Tax=Salinisphaera sp. Q1T1-3 TaxID=2321229 RepID=UPI000E72A092|nr:superoxide dismutase family protein [Salinisphaera sp. Q1T1-3]RJS92850.1 superoxide dismutase family protein [Salinisphaera sp. Q1T1-3]